MQLVLALAVLGFVCFCGALIWMDYLRSSTNMQSARHLVCRKLYLGPSLGNWELGVGVPEVHIELVWDDWDKNFRSAQRDLLKQVDGGNRRLLRGYHPELSRLDRMHNGQLKCRVYRFKTEYYEGNYGFRKSTYHSADTPELRTITGTMFYLGPWKYYLQYTDNMVGEKVIKKGF